MSARVATDDRIVGPFAGQLKVQLLPRLENTLSAAFLRSPVATPSSLVPCLRFGRGFNGLLPSPYQSILRVDRLANVSETAPGQDSRRGVRFRACVCPDHVCLAAVQGVGGQGLRGFGSISLPLVSRVHPVGNSALRGKSMIVPSYASR
jgi:hypothetical protein